VNYILFDQYIHVTTRQNLSSLTNHHLATLLIDPSIVIHQYTYNGTDNINILCYDSTVIVTTELRFIVNGCKQEPFLLF
jgi:hypothetical protein